MPENEFEKQVGKNMEGFGLEPSATVWPAIERRIRKRKKRRFVFWWILLLLMGGGIASIILFFQQPNGKPVVTNTIENRQKEKMDLVKKDSSSAVKEYNEIGLETSIEVKHLSDIKNQKENFNNNAVDPLQEKRITNKKNAVSKFQKSKHLPADTIKSLTVSGFDKIAKKKPSAVYKENEAEVKPVSPTEAITAVKIQPIPIAVAQKTDSNSFAKNNDNTKLTIVDTVENKLLLTDSFSIPLKKETEAHKINGWTLGASISAGRSGFSKGLLSLNKALYADANPIVNSGNTQVPTYNASIITPSFFWSAGVFFTKPIAKKIYFSIGVDYSYLSNRRNIGSRVDSIRVLNNSFSSGVRVDNFYRPSTTSSNNYTNRFHFIHLSADVAWRIVNAGKFNLYWENGIGYSRLLASNMLHYESQLPGYYRDNSLVAKNQFVFSTGLSVPVSNRITVKPFLSYYITPVLKNANSNNSHFSNLGIRLKYFFRNK